MSSPPVPEVPLAGGATSAHAETDQTRLRHEPHHLDEASRDPVAPPAIGARTDTLLSTTMTVPVNPSHGLGDGDAIPCPCGSRRLHISAVSVHTGHDGLLIREPGTVKVQHLPHARGGTRILIHYRCEIGHQFYEVTEFCPKGRTFRFIHGYREVHDESLGKQKQLRDLWLDPDVSCDVPSSAGFDRTKRPSEPAKLIPPRHDDCEVSARPDLVTPPEAPLPVDPPSAFKRPGGDHR